MPTHFPVYGRVRVLRVSRRIVVAVRSILTLVVSSSQFSTYVINRSFSLDLHHQRYETLLQGSFQVQETIYRSNTRACASKFDVDSDIKRRWSSTFRSCYKLWLGRERTSYCWLQCECSAPPIPPLDIYLLLLGRPLILLESLPRFPLCRLVILLL
jgi:hypothetical protein